MKKPATIHQQSLASILATRLLEVVEPGHREVVGRYYASCVSTYEALYRLAALIGKPGRIPRHFGTLLDLEPNEALARAIMATYSEQVAKLMPTRIEKRVLAFWNAGLCH